MTLVAALVVSVLASACAQFPDMPPKPSPKDAGRYESARSFGTGAGEAAPSTWPAEQWWLRYNDAQLNALIAEALKGEPTLAIAQARLHNAEASAQEAGAALLPEVSAQGSVEKQKQSYNNGVPPALKLNRSVYFS